MRALISDAIFLPEPSDRWQAIKLLHEEFPHDRRVTDELGAYVDELGDPTSITYVNYGDDPTFRQNLREALQKLATLGNVTAMDILQRAIRKQ